LKNNFFLNGYLLHSYLCRQILSLKDELIKLATNSIHYSLKSRTKIFYKIVFKTFFSECTFLLLGAEGRAWHVTFAGINVNNCLLLLLACWRLCVCVVGVAGLLLPPGICVVVVGVVAVASVTAALAVNNG